LVGAVDDDIDTVLKGTSSKAQTSVTLLQQVLRNPNPPLSTGGSARNQLLCKRGFPGSWQAYHHNDPRCSKAKAQQRGVGQRDKPTIGEVSAENRYTPNVAATAAWSIPHHTHEILRGCRCSGGISAPWLCIVAIWLCYVTNYLQLLNWNWPGRVSHCPLIASVCNREHQADLAVV